MTEQIERNKKNETTFYDLVLNQYVLNFHFRMYSNYE